MARTAGHGQERRRRVVKKKILGIAGSGNAAIVKTVQEPVQARDADQGSEKARTPHLAGEAHAAEVGSANVKALPCERRPRKSARTCKKRPTQRGEADGKSPKIKSTREESTFEVVAPKRELTVQAKEQVAPTPRGKVKATGGGPANKKRESETSASVLNILDQVLQAEGGGGDDDDDGDGLALDSRKVFVGGLDWELDPQQVRQDFAECGEIADFDMPKSSSGQPLGVAFIVFKTQEGVDNALDFDGDEYFGRRLKVALSDPSQAKRKGRGKGMGGGKGRSKGGSKGKTKGKLHGGKDHKGKRKGKT